MEYTPHMQHVLCLFMVIFAKQITRERVSIFRIVFALWRGGCFCDRVFWGWTIFDRGDGGFTNLTQINRRKLMKILK